MSFAGPILTMAGGVLGAYGAEREAEAQARASEFNANVAEQNAERAILISAQDERRQRIIARKELGSIRAAYGASGVQMEGSPMDVLSESMANAEMDALNIRYAGESKAANLRQEAAYERYRAKESRLSGRIGAAASLLSSGARTYSMIPTGGK